MYSLSTCSLYTGGSNTHSGICMYVYTQTHTCNDFRYICIYINTTRTWGANERGQRGASHRLISVGPISPISKISTHFVTYTHTHTHTHTHTCRWGRYHRYPAPGGSHWSWEKFWKVSAKYDYYHVTINGTFKIFCRITSANSSAPSSPIWHELIRTCVLFLVHLYLSCLVFI